jgi:VWFA-related protein
MRLNRVRAGFVIAFLIILFGSAWYQLDAQEQPVVSQTVIQTGAAEVLVDAVVTDRKNRVVTNLKQEDFQIREDGVPQTITSFHLYHGKPDTTPPSVATSEQAVSSPEAPATGTQEPNLIIILLDYSTTEFENQKRVREASIHYIEDNLRPNDLMAVFVLGSGLRFLTDFTNNKETLVAALKTTDATGSALAGDRSTLSQGIAAGQIDSSQIDTFPATAGGSGPGAGAAGAAAQAQGTQRAAAMLAQRIADQFYAMRSSMDQWQTRKVLTAIRAIALGVKEIQGRKSLILFSGGFVVGGTMESELHSVVDLAHRSRMAIYSIEPQGLETKSLSGGVLPQDELSSISAVNTSQRARMQSHGGETNFDRARQVGSDLRESALRFVANSTGGFLIRNTNDMSNALERVGEEMHSYYLLSYRPLKTDYDGKFREITVDVRGSGLQARTRNGYYAIPSGYEFLTPEEFVLLNQSRNQNSAAPLYLQAAGFQDTGGNYRVPVIVELPTNSIQFNKVEKTHVARLQILGLIMDSQGQFVFRFDEPRDYSISDQEFDLLKAGSVSFMDVLQLPPGKYSFEVAVKDVSSGSVFYSAQGLDLRAPTDQLSVSPILLGKEVNKVAEAGQGFLTIKGVKILPSARCHFRNGDNMIFYFDIYNAQSDTKSKKADVAVQLSLMRNGRPMNAVLPDYQLNELLAEPTPHITLARYLQLANLQPGDYVLLAKVHDSHSGENATSQAAFKVEN